MGQLLKSVAAEIPATSYCEEDAPTRRGCAGPLEEREAPEMVSVGRLRLSGASRLGRDGRCLSSNGGTLQERQETAQRGIGISAVH